jgi:hypothetical protein
VDKSQRNKKYPRKSKPKKVYTNSNLRRSGHKKTRYTDENGYDRGNIGHSNLIHRQVAYHQIYLKNRDKYPLPFSKYVIHHIDGNKKNNYHLNLLLLSEEQHSKIHGKLDLSYDDIDWLIELGFPKWEIKKMIADQRDFSLISLMFGRYGEKITIILKLMFKIGVSIGILILILYYIFSHPKFTLIKYIGFVVLGLGISSLALIFILGLLGLLYGKLGNVFFHISKDIERLFKK